MTDVDDRNRIYVGDDLEVTEVQGRTGVGGAWVSGRLNGHRFQALVFPQQAQRSEWEYKGSRISKLWIQRLSDDCVVFNWDRGMDVPAADALAGAIADFLAAGLADHVFPD
jgi:hypothetical protein